MTDLVEFLRARLDEDEQAARAATSETGRWTWEHGLGEQCNDPECPYGSLLDQAADSDTYAGTVLMDVHGYDVKVPWQGAAHIARHDPARVLREVEAKRRIVEGYAAQYAERERIGVLCEAEIAKGDDLAPAVAELTGQGIVLNSWISHLGWVVRVMGTTYADHPDYQQEWKP